MDISVIHEEPDFLIVNKPAEISMHSGHGVIGETVAAWVREHYPETSTVGDEPDVRPGIVHRLDKDTSGVLVVARTQDAFLALKEIFKSRAVEKTYLALVSGNPKVEHGIIDAPIGRLVRNRTKRGAGKGITAEKPAATEWKVSERLSGFALIEAKPKTGRMHQIRVHLASIGLPVAGDKVYGLGRPIPPGLTRQFLHASELSFTYPEGRRWHFEAALPEDLSKVLASLRVLQDRK